MATINTIGTGLKGTTGTGSFVGATAATLSSPKISAIANAGGDLIVSFSGGASSVNRYTISSAVASSTPTISMQGTDTNIGMQTIVKGAGTYTFLFNSAPSAQVSFNGANGSSLFIPRFCKITKGTDTNAPIQNASIIPNTPSVNPKSHPIPNASFASPNPIHLPPEKYQSEAKNPNAPRPVRRNSRATCQLVIP